MTALTNLEAIPPSPMGSKIHLFQQGYRPGNKHRRGGDHTPPCGVFVHIRQWEMRVPLAQAVREGWGNGTFQPALPPYVSPGKPWAWCRSCIGHALFIVGTLTTVVAQLAQQPTATSRVCLRPDRCAGCTGRTCTKSERYARDHGLEKGGSA